MDEDEMPGIHVRDRKNYSIPKRLAIQILTKEDIACLNLIYSIQFLARDKSKKQKCDHQSLNYKLLSNDQYINTPKSDNFAFADSAAFQELDYRF